MQDRKQQRQNHTPQCEEYRDIYKQARRALKVFIKRRKTADFLMRQNGVTQQPMGMYINHRAEILLKVMSKVYPVIFGKKDTLEKFGTGSIMEKTLVSSSLGRCCA
uniref:Uncharacterized protein n=1 Tax=Glossina pallidipes TaxID=7398 RepID=A0A1A9ZW95_GLOPL